MPTQVESDGWIDRQRAHDAQHGFCFWAVELRATRAFIGAVGLVRVGYQAHFTPAVEIGWRVARPAWGQGYAPEAAGAALRFGFETASLAEIVANAALANENSQRVMRKLGMTRDPAGDYDHPRLPVDNPDRRQVLYRLSRQAWLAQDVSR